MAAVEESSESPSVGLWLDVVFVKLEPPEGTGQGLKGGEGCTALLFSRSVSITGV